MGAKWLGRFAVMVALTLAVVSGGCAGGDEECDEQCQDEKWGHALRDSREGKAVPEAPDYDSGPVPHKIGTLGANSDWIPDAWDAHSLEEFQLGLSWEYAQFETGLVKPYYMPGGRKVYVGILHQVYRFTLRKARTAEVIGTSVIEGDLKFKESYEIPIGTSDGATVWRNDVVDMSALSRWLKPFVEP